MFPNLEYDSIITQNSFYSTIYNSRTKLCKFKIYAYSVTRHQTGLNT